MSRIVEAGSAEGKDDRIFVVRMGLRTLALSVVSVAAFSGVVYATFSIYPGLRLPQYGKLNPLEEGKAGRTWTSGHVDLHLGESGRYFLSYGVAGDEDGSLETGCWRFETPDHMTLQADEGEQRAGTIEGPVLHLEALGSLVEVELFPFCDSGGY